MADEFLTTGQAATLLGVSRQRVVDLCESGRMPFVRAGSHRRLRRRDVEPLVRSTLTKDQERSLWLHRVVVGRLAVSPDEVLAQARANVEVMRNAHRGTSAASGIERWAGLLDGPLDELADLVTARSPRAVELRQNSPFAGVLAEARDVRVLRARCQCHDRDAPAGDATDWSWSRPRALRRRVVSAWIRTTVYWRNSSPAGRRSMPSPPL